MKIGIAKGRIEKHLPATILRPEGQLRWTVGEDEYFLLRGHDIPKLVLHGLLDEGYCGSDALQEDIDSRLLTVTRITIQGDARMVVAAADPDVLSHVTDRPIVVGTSYPNQARARFVGMRPAVFVQVAGCTEAVCPSLVDVIVDISETGTTLAANGLTVIEDLGPIYVVKVSLS